jgi:pimeloyl-ACP methyl ester carboxylesterase
MYQKVNGITLYYEKSGQGRPIILLHGNGENHKIFDVLIPELSKNHTVYAIDSRGHGKSTKVKTLDYYSMAEDIAGFIKTLSIEKPILYGFSDGGILGLIIAFRYPQLLSKLIVSGANIRPEGVKLKYIKSFRLIYFITRSSKYRLMLTQPDIKDEDLKKITVVTYVLAGSDDMIEEIHTRHIAECIPKSTLKILDGEDHMSYVTHSPKLYGIIKPFLEV